MITILGTWHLLDSCFQFLFIIKKVDIKRKVQPFHDISICKYFTAECSPLQTIDRCKLSRCCKLVKHCKTLVLHMISNPKHAKLSKISGNLSFNHGLILIFPLKISVYILSPKLKIILLQTKLALWTLCFSSFFEILLFESTFSLVIIISSRLPSSTYFLVYAKYF